MKDAVGGEICQHSVTVETASVSVDVRARTATAGACLTSYRLQLSFWGRTLGSAQTRFGDIPQVHQCWEAGVTMGCGRSAVSNEER